MLCYAILCIYGGVQIRLGRRVGGKTVVLLSIHKNYPYTLVGSSVSSSHVLGEVCTGLLVQLNSKLMIRKA